MEAEKQREARRRAKGRLVKERITKEDGRYLIYYTFEGSAGDGDSAKGPGATSDTHSTAGRRGSVPGEEG